MGSDKKEFFILKDGQMMFYLSSEGQVSDKDLQKRLLTGSYLTAILQIVENSSSGTIISSMELGNKHIFLRKGQFVPVIFVYVIHTKKVRERRENKRIDKTVSKFESLYRKDQIEQWNGNIQAFKEFKEVAEDELDF